jgi:hypothetical protein
MNRRNQSISVQQAAQDSPTFARLSSLAEESSVRLRSVQSLIPTALRAAIKAGPIDGAVWCLIVDSSAAASKLRQLLPALEAHLRSKGWDVQSIRLKVRAPQGYA